ncbi:MAG: sulfotransferase [bacterium]|nr:sulfotransferase [bacterium]
MSKTFHFLSGLPRSGSTVLAALLSQNPDIYVSATSPLVGLMHGAKHMWDTAEHIKAHAVSGQIERVLGGMAESFYSHTDKSIVIDKNRAWSNPDKQDMLRISLAREPKIIATVRPIAPILASFISLIRKNSQSVSFIDKELLASGQELTDLNRCRLLMGEGGHVYQSWDVLKKGYELYPQNILIIEYDKLMISPAKELARIYSFLEIAPFSHDIENIINVVPENDEVAYNLPGMHAIRPVLKKTAPDPRVVLGEEIFNNYQGGEFWCS